MKRLLLPLALALSGCTINATAPIQANAQLQANTQVDQRSGEFQGGSGQQQTVTNGGPLALGPSYAPTPATPTGPSPTSGKLAFSAVKKFTNAILAQALSFEQVVVADGDVIHVTTDAGLTWQEYKQPITVTAMYWKNSKEGLIGGQGGALYKVTLGGARELLDPGNGNHVKALYWAGDTALLANGASEYQASSDSGTTWTKGLRAGIGSHFSFQALANGTVVLHCYDIESGEAFVYQNGAMVKVADGAELAVGATRLFSEVRRSAAQTEWNVYETLDGSPSRKVGPDIRTTDSILRNGTIRSLTAASDDLLVGQFMPNVTLSEFRLITSSDSGKTWSTRSPQGVRRSRGSTGRSRRDPMFGCRRRSSLRSGSSNSRPWSPSETGASSRLRRGSRSLKPG